jgi:multicomponent Na+:H+ antiporter subunit B
MTTVVMRTTARIVVPIVLVLAISLLLQGHNLPGGGFIAGVLTTAAFALIYVAYGLDYLEVGVLDRTVDVGAGMFEHRSVRVYQRTLIVGLVLVLGSGLAGLLVGDPFLTQWHTSLHGVPLYGDVELASALVFDVGVYCVVVGSLLTILSVVGAE